MGESEKEQMEQMISIQGELVLSMSGACQYQKEKPDQMSGSCQPKEEETIENYFIDSK